MCSAGMFLFSCDGCHLDNAMIKAMKDKAFIMKTNPGLANDAIIKPKMAGPTARPIFNETPPSVIVAGISGFETISRVMAMEEGRLIAAPAPNINVSNNKEVG